MLFNTDETPLEGLLDNLEPFPNQISSTLTSIYDRIQLFSLDKETDKIESYIFAHATNSAVAGAIVGAGVGITLGFAITAPQ